MSFAQKRAVVAPLLAGLAAGCGGSGGGETADA